MIMPLLTRGKDTRAVWEGELPVTNRYTLGLAGERFFREIKSRGRIYGTRCKYCNRTYVPASVFCERCLSELDDWVDVGLKGKLVTFTILHEDYQGSLQKKPEIVAFIRFGDGGLIHRLGEITPEEVKIDMIVEAVLKPTRQREGSILDIKYFKPAT
jgi:uncharacterized OB-fold protein